MARISFGSADVGRQRGLEEVSVRLDHDGTNLVGTARVARGETLADASAQATLAALGSLAPSVTEVRVAELHAGSLGVVHIELVTADEVLEGSCSELHRDLPEAVARAVLDALNPIWGA